MGMSVDAELIFGIDVVKYDDDDDDYDETPLFKALWDEEAEDWRDFAEVLAVQDGAVDPWKSLPDEINHGTSADFEAWKQANPEWVKIKDAWYEAKGSAEKYVRFELRHYGHYDDPDGPRVILTPKDVQTYRGSAWEPAVISAFDGLNVRDKSISKGNESLQAFDIPASFHDAQWLLVASYG